MGEQYRSSLTEEQLEALVAEIEKKMTKGEEVDFSRVPGEVLARLFPGAGDRGEETMEGGKPVRV